MLHCVLYDTMYKNMVQPDRPYMTVWRMHFAGWMPKATDTHSEYVTLQGFYGTMVMRTCLIVMLYI